MTFGGMCQTWGNVFLLLTSLVLLLISWVSRYTVIVLVVSPLLHTSLHFFLTFLLPAQLSVAATRLNQV